MTIEIMRYFGAASVIISLGACVQDPTQLTNSKGQESQASLVTKCDTIWDDQGYFATDNCISTLIIEQDSISFTERDACPFRLCDGESKFINHDFTNLYVLLFDCQLIKYSMSERTLQKRIILGPDELKRGCEECRLIRIGNLIVYQCKTKVSMYNDDLVLIYNSDRDAARVEQGYLTPGHLKLQWDSGSIYITKYAYDPLDSLYVIGTDTISH